MRLGREFFLRDALEVAPELVGKTLVSSLPGAQERRLVITETEVYRGVEDSACHAHRGRTKRTEMLYRPGGRGLCLPLLRHTLAAQRPSPEPEDFPRAVLIRACEGFEGPGKLTKYLGITGAQNGIDICSSPLLRIEDEGRMVNITTDKRVGIAYAEEADRERLWRFKRG